MSRSRVSPALLSARKNAPCWPPTSGISSFMISSATTARSRWPCIRPAIRARLVCSQPCCWLASVVSRSEPTIALMLSFSSATSPSASTEIDRVRSPVATALVTSAIARTCLVRSPASSLTFSVSRFQVPDTPSTSAWPPSRPSLPTSRATRVTSAANEESWSTIVLIVVFSSRISPAGVDVDLLGQVALGDRGGDLRDVAHLAGQVVRHRVDVVGQVLPGARPRSAPSPGRRACPRCPPRGPPGSPRRRTPTACPPSC